jgi:farnesyl diphosphate synthase
MVACNDYILLECCIYRLLKFHFAGASNYTQILDLFLEVGRRVGEWVTID